jgi:hypothetical protein
MSVSYVEGFNSGMVESDFNSANVIWSLSAAPGLVVRETRHDYSVDTQLAIIKEFKVALSDFTETTGTAVPNPNFVITKAGTGSEEDRPVTYTVLDHVYGVNLDELPEIPQEVRVSALTGLVRYFSKITTHGGLYLADMDTSQCMYGTTDRSHQPDVYFVDMDMYTDVYDPSARTASNIQCLSGAVSCMARALQASWRHYGSVSPELRDQIAYMADDVTDVSQVTDPDNLEDSNGYYDWLRRDIDQRLSRC